MPMHTHALTYRVAKMPYLYIIFIGLFPQKSPTIGSSFAYAYTRTEREREKEREKQRHTHTQTLTYTYTHTHTSTHMYAREKTKEGGVRGGKISA